MAFAISNAAIKKVQSRRAPEENESLLHSDGYTKLNKIGPAADSPALSDAPIWRTVYQFQETVGTVKNYLIPNKSKSGLGVEDVVTPLDVKDPTSLSYLGLQRLLAGYIPTDLKTARKLIGSVTKPLDDRELLLEDMVAWLATAGRSRDHGPNAAVNSIQGLFIDKLWKDLTHPPLTYLAPEYRYRTIDGSFNNLNGLPYLGAANQPYARSVKPAHPMPPNIAEPEEFFDSILRRPEGEFTKHPSGLSSMFFAFANLVIHDLFWTNNTGEIKPIPGESQITGGNKEMEERLHEQSHDPSQRKSDLAKWQNLTSSYVSLDPLYGINKAENDLVRDRSEENLGRGLLHNDTFASNRILLMPPASSVILVLLSRNHNRIARKVLELNESNKWNCNLSELTPEQRRIQDDEIFGTARLVNCGYAINVVLNDYLQAILGTVQADSNWSLDPRMKIGNTPTAVGNAVSVEFNILYRWHAIMSKEQTMWLEDRFKNELPDKNWNQLNLSIFFKAVSAMRKNLNAGEDSEPRYWKLSKYEVSKLPNGELKVEDDSVYERDPKTGKFNDADLAKILASAIQDPAGTFGAQHNPAIMRWIDCEGMRTARDVWKTCTLNEFRSFLGLKTFDSFSEWNSNPIVSKAMEDLVGSPDNIPLHVGLHGEEAKEPRLGAGLCPNYTISRAILSDAVALVRGDRFYTECESTDGMTEWGLLDCQPDVQAGSYGGMLPKIITNNLPNQFVYNDVALMFPFMVPTEMYKILQGISPEKARNYALNPPPPTPLGFKQNNNSEIHEVSDTEKVMVERMNELFGSNNRSNISLVYASLDTHMTGQEWRTFEKFIVERIRRSSTQRSPVSFDQTVDILRDVTNPLISGWLASMFGLIETGMHSKQLLLSALSDIYKYLSEPQMTFKNRTAARVAASGLAWQLKNHIEAASGFTLSIPKLINKGTSIATVGALNLLESSVKFITGESTPRAQRGVHADCREFYKTLVKKNGKVGGFLNSDELAADCLRAIATLAFNLSNGASCALDHLVPKSSGPDVLGGEFDEGLQKLIEMDAKDPDGFANIKIRELYCRYGLEASRLNHWNPILRGLTVKKECLDRKSLNQPIGVIDKNWSLERKDYEYRRLFDIHGHCLKFYEELIAVIIREVVTLPKVSKSFGKQGDLSRIKMIHCNSGLPSMHIKYDGSKGFELNQKKR